MARFLPPAGTLLAQASPGTNNCGTTATGWTNGTLPTVQGSTLDIQVTCCYCLFDFLFKNSHIYNLLKHINFQQSGSIIVLQ